MFITLILMIISPEMEINYQIFPVADMASCQEAEQMIHLTKPDEYINHEVMTLCVPSSAYNVS